MSTLDTAITTESLATEIETQLKRTRAEINRENAKKSTGPRTAEGKAKVRFNATRHHLTSQLIVLPEGEFAAYTALLDRYEALYSPVGEMEITLVGQIANATWRLNYSHTYEMSLMALHHNPHHPGIAADNPTEVTEALANAAAPGVKTKDFANLSLYRTREFRLIEKSLPKLEALQTARKAKEAADLEAASRLMRLHQAEQEEQERASNPAVPFVPKPYHPAADGFVFSAPEIVAYVHRNHRAQEADKLHFRTSGAPLKAAA